MALPAHAPDATAAIHAVLEAWSDALRRKDAAAVVALHADDLVEYSLAPPLVAPGDGMASLNDWFATWDGPIHLDASDVQVRAAGDLAVAYGLARMRGTKTDGTTPDLWFRLTACLARDGAGWKVVHLHESVPFYMDGSFRAAVDLTP